MFYPGRNWWKSVPDISHRKANFCIENAKSGKQRKSHVQNIDVKGCDFLKNAKFISILFKFAFLFWNWFSSKNIRLTIFSLIIFKIWQKSDLSRYECTYNVSGIRIIHCPGLWNFLCLWMNVKWPEIQACKKLSFPVHRGIFCCYLDSTHTMVCFFLTKIQKRTCGSGGQYALSCGSFPCLFWCQYSFPYALSQLP